MICKSCAEYIEPSSLSMIRRVSKELKVKESKAEKILSMYCEDCYNHVDLSKV